MERQTGLALVVMAVLLVKHCLFDFVLQTRFQLANKHVYGHQAGLLHAAAHALGTTPIFLIMAPTPLAAAAILGGEFASHYHIDWAKAALLRRAAWSSADRWYWALFGADQLTHQLIYLAMVWALAVRFGAGLL
jgi:hypothetical protein